MGAFRLEDFPKIRPFIKNRAVNLQNKVIQMAQRYFFSVVVLIFLFYGEIFGQEKNVEKIPVFFNNCPDYRVFLVGRDVSGYLLRTPIKRLAMPLGLNYPHPGCGTVPTETKFYIPWSHALPLLTPDYYMDNLSFFCRKEWQIEKATSIPFRFRLGSLDYTNYLEQKPNSGFRP